MLIIPKAENASIFQQSSEMVLEATPGKLIVVATCNVIDCYTYMCKALCELALLRAASKLLHFTFLTFLLAVIRHRRIFWF